MPIISSLVAEKRMWLSNESGAFPVNPNEALVASRLFEFCNKFEHMRVTLDIERSNKTPHLFLILGYEEWEFLSYGKFNAYPYFKIQYVLSQLSQFFNKSAQALPFKIRIFLTQQANSDRHTFFSSLEEKGYGDIEVPFWFYEDMIERDMIISGDQRHLYMGKNAKELIGDEIRATIDAFYNQFTDKIKHYAVQLQLPDLTYQLWLKTFRSSLDRITTIQNFSDIVNAPTNFLREYFYQTYSMQAHMAELPPIYKYVIDTSSTANGLRTKFEYTSFILQFVIDPILEEKNKVYKINHIEINKPDLALMLSKLSGTIQRYRGKQTDLEKEINYTVYAVNEGYYRSFPVLDAENKATFNNLNFMRRTLGSFYNRNKKDELQQALESNSYEALERKIPISTEYFSSLLKESLNKQTKTITVKMIPAEMNQYEHSRLTSLIDFQQYTKKRDQLLIKQDEKLEDLLHTIHRLPFSFNFAASIGVALFLMALFCVPVFSWENWDNLLILLPVFASAIGVAAYFSLRSTREDVSKSIFELEEIRTSLTNNLGQHCNNIKDAATQMAEAFAKRETLKGLKQLQANYNEKSYKMLAYDKFHSVNKQSIDQLCKIYGIEISPVDQSSLNISYEKHPQDDPNLITEFPINDLDVIINQQSDRMKDVRTIIKKFEIRSV